MGPLKVGTTLSDKYKIERLLAESGGVILYEATDTARAQRVWIKILERSAMNDPKALGHFQREAGGAKVLDVGKSADGLPYMVATEFGPEKAPAVDKPPAVTSAAKPLAAKPLAAKPADHKLAGKSLDKPLAGKPADKPLASKPAQDKLPADKVPTNPAVPKPNTPKGPAEAAEVDLKSTLPGIAPPPATGLAAVTKKDDEEAPPSSSIPLLADDLVVADETPTPMAYPSSLSKSAPITATKAQAPGLPPKPAAPKAQEPSPPPKPAVAAESPKPAVAAEPPKPAVAAEPPKPAVAKPAAKPDVVEPLEIPLEEDAETTPLMPERVRRAAAATIMIEGRGRNKDRSNPWTWTIAIIAVGSLTGIAGWYLGHSDRHPAPSQSMAPIATERAKVDPAQTAAERPKLEPAQSQAIAEVTPPPAPTTSASAAPVSAAPVSAAPVSAAPVSAAPVSAAPARTNPPPVTRRRPPPPAHTTSSDPLTL